MKFAMPTDWKTEALPSKRTTIRLDRRFSPGEMESIRRGLVPEEMEDKWFIYWKDDTLFFHRSWTGFCIYVVRFVADGESFHMVEAEVNRDPAQYTQTDDSEDIQMISFLVDVLLLRRQSSFPTGDSSDKKRALKTWSQVGRAMFDQHPDDE